MNPGNNNGGSIYRDNPADGYNPYPNEYSMNGYNPNPNGNPMNGYNPNGSFVDGKFVNDYDMGRKPSTQPETKYDPEAIEKLGVIFFIMAVVMFLLSFAFGQTAGRYKTECTEITEGVIVDIVSSNKKGYHTRRTTYTPYVEYTVNSETYNHRVTNPAPRNLFHVGDKMMVHYDPSDPNNCYVDRERTGNNGASIVIGICGGLTFLGGLYVILFANKKKQDKYRRYGI